MRIFAWLASVLATLGLSQTAALAAAPIRVELGPEFHEPARGRLIVFAEPLERAQRLSGGRAIEAVDADLSAPDEVSLTASEVELEPGAAAGIDSGAHAFPRPLSTLPPGRYAIQAVLDRRHTYAYSGRGAGDLLSPVTILTLPAGGELELTQALPNADPTAPWPDMTADERAELRSAVAHTQPVTFESPVLTRFLHKPTYIRGWVLLPPGYDPKGPRRYPTVFYTHGFGDDAGGLLGAAMYMDRAMSRGHAPPMIWVYLDESSPFGTHEFADSANDGPWGRALTQELIPALERRYRMDGTVHGRFLNGHSSGGWATLWLQTHYPGLFGGTWSTSPDPADFHDFFQADLYEPRTNLYRMPDGSERPALRDHGRIQASFRSLTLMGAVLGDYGDQISSFEAVFSPKGSDGKPARLFDRLTGDLDPAIAAYWCAHYDIARFVEMNWPSLRSHLDGKIHVIVGTEDSYFLDGPAHRLQGVLDRLGARSDFRYLPGRTHNDVYQKGADDEGLLLDIAREMYRSAQIDTLAGRARAP
jgi:enterochelin esterase-like enzyme